MACGMLLLLLECYYCLWNVTIAGGMLLLRVECYYCMWYGIIACGMVLLLVEYYYYLIIEMLDNTIGSTIIVISLLPVELPLFRIRLIPS